MLGEETNARSCGIGTLGIEGKEMSVCGLHALHDWRVYLVMDVDRERPSPNLNKHSIAGTFRME